jgi:hypothetical protein
MSRRIPLLTLAFAFVVGRLSADDSINVEVAPGTVVGAGFGQMSPARQDLRITVQTSAGNFYFASADDMTGMTMWSVESQGTTGVTLVSYGAAEDEMGWINVSGMIYDPADPYSYYTNPPFQVAVANALFPCKQCQYDPQTGTYGCDPGSMTYAYCDGTQEGEIEVTAGGQSSTSVTVHHGLSGTLTIMGASGGLEVLNPDGTPFTAAYLTGAGVHSVPLLLRAPANFTDEVTLTCRFIHDVGPLDSQDVLTVKAKQCGEMILTLSPLDSDGDGIPDKDDDDGLRRGATAVHRRPA